MNEVNESRVLRVSRMYLIRGCYRRDDFIEKINGIQFNAFDLIISTYTIYRRYDSPPLLRRRRSRLNACLPAYPFAFATNISI